jgi:hypothetical protein
MPPIYPGCQVSRVSSRDLVHVRVRLSISVPYAVLLTAFSLHGRIYHIRTFCIYTLTVSFLGTDDAHMFDFSPLFPAVYDDAMLDVESRFP